MLIPAMKLSSRSSTPVAPHQAVVSGTSAAAHSNSASGKSQASGSAKDFGTPKSVIDFREPLGSASFAIPAMTKTTARNSRANNRLTLIENTAQSRLSFQTMLDSINSRQTDRINPGCPANLIVELHGGLTNHLDLDQLRCSRHPDGLFNPLPAGGTDKLVSSGV